MASDAKDVGLARPTERNNAMVAERCSRILDAASAIARDYSELLSVAARMAGRSAEHEQNGRWDELAGLCERVSAAVAYLDTAQDVVEAWIDDSRQAPLTVSSSFRAIGGIEQTRQSTDQVRATADREATNTPFPARRPLEQHRTGRGEE
jgi:hypothetical protein